MTNRDANADPLFDMFDFGKASFLTPASLPTPTVDQAKVDDCAAKFPSHPVDFGVGGPVDGGGTD